MITINSKLSGRFRLRATSVETGKQRLLSDWFDNLILDQGLEYPGNTDNYLAFCQVGTSSTPPQVTDSALGAYVASQGTTGSNPSAQISAPYYGSKVFQYSFAVGAAQGNISEAGVGIQAATGGLFSRVVLPQTVTVLANEILDVDYELRIYPGHLVVTNTTVDIDGVTYNVEVLASNVTNPVIWGAGLGDMFAALPEALWVAWDSSATLGPVTGEPSGTLIGDATSVTESIYVSSSQQRDLTILYGTDKANDAGGIGAVAIVANSGSYQITFSPPIPKTNLLELRLIWRQIWSRQ